MFVLGVFDSPESVAAAVGRYRKRLGFRDHPAQFRCLELPLDDSSWCGGRPLAEIGLSDSLGSRPVP